jgi:hypothetical protein
MTLKGVVENLEAIDKSLHSIYEKGADGKFYVMVDGLVPVSRVDEFRTNNIALKKQLEQFEGLDPTRYKELNEQAKKLKEKTLIEAGDIDKVVEERVKAMRTEFVEKNKALQTANDGVNQQLSVLLVDSAVKSAAVTLGVVPTAIDDVVLRAKSIFKVQTGQVVALNEKGEVRYGKDGTTPLTITEWAKDLKVSAPHLFEGVKGAGSLGNRGGFAGDGSKLSSVQKIAAGLAAAG